MSCRCFAGALQVSCRWAAGELQVLCRWAAGVLQVSCRWAGCHKLQFSCCLQFINYQLTDCFSSWNTSNWSTDTMEPNMSLLLLSGHFNNEALVTPGPEPSTSFNISTIKISGCNSCTLFTSLKVWRWSGGWIMKFNLLLSCFWEESSPPAGRTVKKEKLFQVLKSKQHIYYICFREKKSFDIIVHIYKVFLNSFVQPIADKNIKLWTHICPVEMLKMTL